MVTKILAIVALTCLAFAAPAIAKAAKQAVQDSAFAAYLGSTQASSIANPPVLFAGILGASPDIRIAGGTTMLTFNNYGKASTATGQVGQNAGGRFWHYFTTDVSTAVLNSGYFTDAGPLGMRPFDVLAILACGSSNSTASLLRWTYVTSISTAGAAVLSSGMTSTS